LARQIFDAVRDGRYVISRHANERLRFRRIAAWQVISGIEDATILDERPKAEPNPTVELEQRLADGTPVKVIWSWLNSIRTAKLITVHFFDGES